MKISLIAAVAANGTIGRDGGLPWRLPADLARFKRLTMGHHLLLGRRTWESIGRALSGRTTIVITREQGYVASGAQVVHSLDEALECAVAAGDDEAFIGGGAEIYRLALPRAQRMYVTEVHQRIDGDTVFPEWNRADWRLTERIDRRADERHEHAFSLLTYDRRKP